MSKDMMKTLQQFFVAALLLSCGAVASAAPLTVAVAADLKFAMLDIATAFQQINPASKVEVISGSSGKFYQQIANGAPFDIYFSADIEYPRKLKEQGFAVGEVKTYAYGQLVLWSATLPVEGGLAVLAGDRYRKVAIANPEHAPYGKRAKDSLTYYGLLDKVAPKLVLGENVSQAAQFAVSGAADAAIIALSLVLAPGMKGQGSYFLIDERSHMPLEQGYAVLKHAANNPDAAKFSHFITTGEVKAILKKYGFRIPNAAP
ncbi:MAG: molybdate ABC transporter substrate-binding protein [Gallionella sp.]|nr:molybdate ABC transporter substrate-binding protein [Gallionella sp.]